MQISLLYQMYPRGIKQSIVKIQPRSVSTVPKNHKTMIFFTQAKLKSKLHKFDDWILLFNYDKMCKQTQECPHTDPLVTNPLDYSRAGLTIFLPSSNFGQHSQKLFLNSLAMFNDALEVSWSIVLLVVSQTQLYIMPALTISVKNFGSDVDIYRNLLD